MRVDDLNRGDGPPTVLEPVDRLRETRAPGGDLREVAEDVLALSREGVEGAAKSRRSSHESV